MPDHLCGQIAQWPPFAPPGAIGGLQSYVLLHVPLLLGLALQRRMGAVRAYLKGVPIGGVGCVLCVC